MPDYSEAETLLTERLRKRASHISMDDDSNNTPSSSNVCHFSSLPKWLQDNDYLHCRYRRPVPSFSVCFRSIFRIHTETGNIWTHLLGCLVFIVMATNFLTRTDEQFQWKDKMVFAFFFAGAILCLGMSSTYHTVNCHSQKVARLFKKLDYCGIALLIMGSFVPWLYYGFYCDLAPKVIYLTMVSGLGGAAIIVSLLDKFGETKFRPVRAGVFVGFGLSGVFPAVHHLVRDGWLPSIYQGSIGWLFLMAVMYIAGALFYAMRVPERYLPGKCDICVQSHQIFHVLVVAAAFVHYHGITELATHKLSLGECS